MDVLVLGASGGLGRLVCAVLAARGHRTQTVTRGEARDAEALARAVPRGGDAIGADELERGGHAIVNCAGASVALGLGHGWRGYRDVDMPIGLAAMEAHGGRARGSSTSACATRRRWRAARTSTRTSAWRPRCGTSTAWWCGRPGSSRRRRRSRRSSSSPTS